MASPGVFHLRKETMPYNVKVDVWPHFKPFTKYIEDLIHCSCFPDLLEAKVYPNAKEMTESMAAYHVAIRKLREFDLSDSTVHMYAVGDGRTPRTATLFAFRTGWNCVSIDPDLNMDHVQRWSKIKRLTLLKNKIEDLPELYSRKAFVACVHSHAKLNEVCRKITADHRIVVAIPCCVPQRREREPDLQYEDRAIWSPCNTVKVWVDRKEKP